MPVPPPDHPDYRFTLANERTLLAWVRFGLAASGFGFIVARLGLPDRDSLSQWVGVGMVLLGPLLILVGAVRFFSTERDIERRVYTRRYGLIWTVILVGIVLTVVLAAYLVFTILRR